MKIPRISSVASSYLGHRQHDWDLAYLPGADELAREVGAVERVREEEPLRAFFEALGYDRQHAAIRARVFYYHQVGYYAIGVLQSIAERRKNAHLYIDIICGEEKLAGPRASAGKSRKARAA